MRSILLTVGLGCAAVLFAAAGPAFTAREPAPAGGAVGEVSGYRVSKVSYSLDPEASERVASVSFALEPTGARIVRARLGARWATCISRAGHASCRFAAPLPRLVDLRTLTVLAAS